MSEANKAVFRNWGKVWADIDLIDKFIGDGHTVNGVAYGPETAKGTVRGFLGTFPDIKMEFHEQLDVGDKVITRWSLAGTDTGGFRGRRPTGRRVQWMGIVISRIDKGKLVEEWETIDEVGLFTQLGFLPEGFPATP